MYFTTCSLRLVLKCDATKSAEADSRHWSFLDSAAGRATIEDEADAHRAFDHLQGKLRRIERNIESSVFVLGLDLPCQVGDVDHAAAAGAQ